MKKLLLLSLVLLFLSLLPLQAGAEEPAQIFDHPQGELTRRFIRQLSVLELRVDGRDCDLIAAGGEIDRYCLLNQISAKEKYRIRLAIEELVLQILLPRLTTPHIRILVERAAGDAGSGVTVRYGGEAFDPRDTDNTLALTVLQSAAEELRYRFEPEAQEPNLVELRIRGV